MNLKVETFSSPTILKKKIIILIFMIFVVFFSENNLNGKFISKLSQNITSNIIDLKLFFTELPYFCKDYYFLFFRIPYFDRLINFL